MADIPAEIFSEVLEFVRSFEPVGPEAFLARQVHLYAFESDDWDAEWWHTLTWRLIGSWQLS
jgi:hypothetical protein